jgi:Protein of unknown function (DUF3017)
MTPDMQQARTVIPRGDDPPYPPMPGRSGPTAETAIVSGRSGPTDVSRGDDASWARTGNWGAAVQPAAAVQGTRASARHANESARRAREDARTAGVTPLLAVLAIVAVGVYIAWHQGSAGGGVGGMVGGAALLAAAVARLLLPARLVGLLAIRKRAADVITLAAFGACLLVVGLVLPR